MEVKGLSTVFAPFLSFSVSFAAKSLAQQAWTNVEGRNLIVLATPEPDGYYSEEWETVLGFQVKGDPSGEKYFFSTFYIFR